MDLFDARLHLKLADGEDPVDAYEQQVFKLKQFFLSNVPTSKTFSAKQNRLMKIHEAYIALGGVMEPDPCEKPLLKLFNADDVLESVHTFQGNTNQIKLQIALSENALCISKYGQMLIDNMEGYAKLWDLKLKNELENVLLTKEPDSVEMLKAIGRFNREGYKRFDEIVKLGTASIVYQESIRLSLWLKMERNE